MEVVAGGVLASSLTPSQPEAFSRWLQDTVKTEAIDCVIPVYEETFHHGLNHGLLDCDHFIRTLQP